MKPYRTLPSVAVACILIVAGCGGDDDTAADVFSEDAGSASSGGDDSGGTLVSSNDPPLTTDSREGSIKLLAGECYARFERGDGTVTIDVTGAEDFDLCGVAEQIAQTLVPRFPQAG